MSPVSDRSLPSRGRVTKELGGEGDNFTGSSGDEVQVTAQDLGSPQTRPN